MRTTHSIDDHKNMNYERFHTRDEQLRRAADQRSEFIRSEINRENRQDQNRDLIMKHLAMDLEQKKEMTKLRVMDTKANQERERRKKQEA